jgi:heat-inducible transcriptional repressor
MGAMSAPRPPALSVSISPLAGLDLRAREIFREIVEAYLVSGEAVGSRTLSRRGVNLSPASIRNVMADLADLGLLESAHSSAGRAPTTSGLRLFVDGLLQVGEVTEAERRRIEEGLAGSGRSTEEILAQASDLLSGLAGGAGMVASPARDARVRHVEFISLGPSPIGPALSAQILAIIVDEDGMVENRLFTLPTSLTASTLTEATNFLNNRLRGRTLAEAREAALSEVDAGRAALDVAAASLVRAGLAEWTGEDPQRGRSLIVRGHANLLQDAKAAQDLERVRRLFDDLERKQDILHVLDTAREAQATRLFIGSENPLFSLSGSSVIVAPYMRNGRQLIGALGVIGPMRLNYARVIPMVDYTAKLVGRMLDVAALTGEG